MKLLPILLLPVLVGSVLAGCGQDSPSRVALPSVGDEQNEGGGEERAHGVVTLTDGQIAAAEIELAAAGPARIRETLQLYGVITPNAVGVRQVTARFPGVIQTVAKSFGDTVKQGEALAEIESNESLRRYTLTSPINGVVSERDANLGEQTGERRLFTIADLSTVWVEISLFPRDVGKVKVDQTVRVRGVDPGATADGRVIWVAPFGSSANQTRTARVLVDNAERRWAPGLYVTADVTLAEAEVPLTVKNAALQTLDDRTVVFVREGDHFELRPVELGRRDSEHVEITSGLAAGDSYAAENSFILKADLGKGEAGDDD
jgi:cobalt-zinc-cadmium efflux system membrane fusion protein